MHLLLINRVPTYNKYPIPKLEIHKTWVNDFSIASDFSEQKSSKQFNKIPFLTKLYFKGLQIRIWRKLSKGQSGPPIHISNTNDISITSHIKNQLLPSFSKWIQLSIPQQSIILKIIYANAKIERPPFSTQAIALNHSSMPMKRSSPV